MTKSKAQQALEYFRHAARVCPTPRDLHNVFFGIDGKLGHLFPTREERESFFRSPEFAEIDRIREAIDPDPEEQVVAAKPRKSRPAKR